MTREKKSHSAIADAVYGLIAGAAATFVMEKVSTWGYKLENPKKREYEENLRGGEYPPQVLAQKVVETVTGASPAEQTKQKLGMAIHWGYGIVGGGLFGALRSSVPAIASVGGLTYGVGLWLIGDELMMPIMKLSPASTEFPWENHARAAVNHLAYGGTVALTHNLLRRVSEAVNQENGLRYNS